MTDRIDDHSRDGLSRRRAAFPPGTPVCVRQSITRPRGDIEAEIVGVIDGWEERPTGSWYTGGRDGKLWLTRLRLRKVDGELVSLVVDAATHIAKLESIP